MKLTCEFDRAQYLTGQEIRLYLPEGANAPRVCVYRLEAPIDCSVRQSERTLILPPLPAAAESPSKPALHSGRVRSTLWRIPVR